jgi:cob(I)alamin adenosyltransferase
MEAIGTLDEASAALGLARSLIELDRIVELITAVQRDLYLLMAEAAAAPGNQERFREIDAGRVKWLEEQTNEIAREVKVPDQFILPGGTPSAAAFSLARTVVRRAERRLVQLFQDGSYANLNGLAYLNRLSSLCFLLELLAQKDEGGPTLAKGG